MPLLVLFLAACGAAQDPKIRDLEVERALIEEVRKPEIQQEMARLNEQKERATDDERKLVLMRMWLDRSSQLMALNQRLEDIRREIEIRRK